MKSTLFMGKSIKNPVTSTDTAISYITKNIKFPYKAGIKEISASKKENSCICCTEQMQSAKENEGPFFLQIDTAILRLLNHFSFKGIIFLFIIGFSLLLTRRKMLQSIVFTVLVALFPKDSPLSFEQGANLPNLGVKRPWISPRSLIYYQNQILK